VSSKTSFLRGFGEQIEAQNDHQGETQNRKSELNQPLRKKSREEKAKTIGERPGDSGHFRRGEEEKLIKTDARDRKQQEIEQPARAEPDEVNQNGDGNSCREPSLQMGHLKSSLFLRLPGKLLQNTCSAG